MLAPHLIRQSITDFLSPKLLAYSILPFFITFAIFAALYLGFGAEQIDAFKLSLEQGVVPFIDAEKHPIITWILTIGVFKWLFTIFFYLVGAVAVVLFSVLVAVVVIGFFTPFIVKAIQAKHYPQVNLKGEDFSTGFTIWRMVKTGVIFMVLFVIAIPFLFIPAVNFIAINIPFYYLFHNFLMLDVGSTINTKEEFKTLTKSNKIAFRGTTLTLFGISLVPLLGMLLQVLFVIMLSHQFFVRTKALRGL